MGHSSYRVERDSIVADVHRDPDSTTVTTGSYGPDQPGIRLTLNHYYVAEVIDEDIEDDLEQLLEIALADALERIMQNND
jgi:hypothetical protein